MVKRSQYVVSMGRASVASVPRAGFPDSLVFLGFLVLEESLIYRIDIREGRGKLNAFIILHEIQAVSPSSSAASYDENFFVLADVPVAQGGFTGGGIFLARQALKALNTFSLVSLLSSKFQSFPLGSIEC